MSSTQVLVSEELDRAVAQTGRGLSLVFQVDPF